jgi:hypothetical protein
MTPEEQTILKLTRENIELENKIKDLERERSSVEMHLAKADVPTGFEDGNSWDNYGFSERVGVLCDMHARAKAIAAHDRETCAEAVKELVALREDKARLDWLDTHRWAAERFERFQYVRVAIDHARQHGG